MTGRINKVLSIGHLIACMVGRLLDVATNYYNIFNYLFYYFIYLFIYLFV